MAPISAAISAPRTARKTARTVALRKTSQTSAASWWRSASAAARTKTFVTKHEAEGVALAAEHVSPDATVYADEAAHWDDLHASFPVVGRINHTEAYSTEEANTNQAESYFSRLRRMVDGQHHHVSARYLYQYAAEAAWKEDHRRLPNGAAFSPHDPAGDGFAG